MSDDIRVILIKICDRLHNMRTLASQPANKQYKIAGETLYIYAPIANRLGLNKIKTELEDLSFRYEHPEEYASIQEKIASTQEQRDELFTLFTAPIKAELDKMGFSYKIKARVKSPYSIWNKMQAKHISFDEIYDILAVRIIYEPKKPQDEINNCFQIYVAISQIYKSHPDRLRDWVNHPKANGYQALHVTLMSNQGRWIEVQIRSERMNYIAEQGFAAHWIYKDGTKMTDEEGELNDWLRTIKEILDDPQPDAMDFLDVIKLNLFASEIFVFTPKGEIKTMPAGCTALDFAFQIHTFIGSHCIGAKVNHKLVPLSHKLKSGDQVEILTSMSQRIDPSWVNIVSTAKAKGKIQALLRREGREIQKAGETALEEWLKAKGFSFTTSILDKLTEIHHFKKHDQLFEAIGRKIIILGDADIEELEGRKKKETKKISTNWRKYVPFLHPNQKEEGTTDSINIAKGLIVVNKDINKKKPIYISEDNIGQFIFPTCCHAIPGDDTLGYIDNNNHIEIHKRACPVAAKLKAGYGPRILDVKWDMHNQLFFDATIDICGIDRPKILRDVAEVVSDQLGINIRKTTISSERGIFEGSLELQVHDRKQVFLIMEKLRQISGMQTVRQIL